MALVSSLYKTQPRKWTVNTQRMKRETMRRKLALASFIPVPRLVKGFHNNPVLTAK